MVPQLREALLKVAEDPNRPGMIDEDRLERWLHSVEGKPIIGLKFVRAGRDANGRLRWQLQEDKR
jgi:hypothetical protein